MALERGEDKGQCSEEETLILGLEINVSASHQRENNVSRNSQAAETVCDGLKETLFSDDEEWIANKCILAWEMGIEEINCM